MKVPLLQYFPPNCDLEKAAQGPREPHPPETRLAACSHPGVTFPFSHE